MRKLSIFFLSVAAFSAGPASAAPDRTEAPIIVEGERDTAVRNYVEALASASPGEKMARFEKPICPKSVGLSKDMNAEVEDRIRRVAGAAGIAVAPARCAGNVLLFVTADRPGFIQTLQRERPQLFGLMTEGETRALAAQRGDAIAWQVFDQRGADGRTLNNAGARDEGPATLTGVTSSRLLPQTRTDLDVAIIVLEPAAFTGATVTQLADYVAMRTLVQSAAPAVFTNGSAPTILSLLEDKRLQRPAAMSVTAYDLAYLKALYGMSNALQAVPQRAELMTRMKQNLAGRN